MNMEHEQKNVRLLCNVHVTKRDDGQGTRWREQWCDLRKDEDAPLCTSRHVVCVDREDQSQIWTEETEMMELIIVTGGTGEGRRPYRSGCFTAPPGARDFRNGGPLQRRIDSAARNECWLSGLCLSRQANVALFKGQLSERQA